MVTSVTLAACAMSRCVLSSAFFTHERYRAAAARPMGSLPADTSLFWACFSTLIAYRFVFSAMPMRLAILETHWIESVMGMRRSSSLTSRR